MREMSSSHTLLVVAHPDGESLTHHVAHELRAVLKQWGTVEVADLHREGFDPRWLPADRRSYQGVEGAPRDVAVEHDRLDRATDLVLVFPVYWWSMPALMKGWIDRVFINGWAFGEDASHGLVKKLGKMTIHIVAVAASGSALYDRHGYAAALRTQIQHGPIDYCGASRGPMTFVHDSEDGKEGVRTLRVRTAVEAITGHFAADAARSGVTSVRPQAGHVGLDGR